MALSVKGFDQFVVARLLHQDGRSRVGAATAIDIVSPIDTAVVKDHYNDRQVVAADRLDLHAVEAERAVALSTATTGLPLTTAAAIA
jgi:hypothetical protein